MKIKQLLTRREFFKNSAQLCGLGTCWLASSMPISLLASKTEKDEIYRKEARYFEKLPNRKIKCLLCPRECVIDDQETGYCGVRENHKGTYYTLVYGRACSANVDPIEKKPLFHFFPGSKAFSIATAGCNVLCKFCQNWEISQARPDQINSYTLFPADVAAYAKRTNCKIIAYTYSEPVIFYEYMYDCAEKGHEVGVRSVMITNGYIQAQPMRDLCDVLDAVKIDLKAFTEKFYREIVAGHLKPVLDTLILLKEEGMWTEIVYLVIPTLNDDPKELKQMCKWIMDELGADVPIHFSRFYPVYRLRNLPPTPPKTLEMARDIALDAGIHYAYIGNVPGHEGENTFCPQCKKVIIRRIGYQVLENHITARGQCEYCNQKIPGVWQ